MRDRGQVPDQWLPLFKKADIAVSYRALAERAGIDHTRARGVLLGAGTTEEAVAAVAAAFRVTPRKVWELHGEPVHAPFTLPFGAGRLNRREREAVLAVVDAILDAKTASGRPLAEDLWVDEPTLHTRLATLTPDEIAELEWQLGTRWWAA